MFSDDSRNSRGITVRQTVNIILIGSVCFFSLMLWTCGINSVQPDQSHEAVLVEHPNVHDRELATDAVVVHATGTAALEVEQTSGVSRGTDGAVLDDDVGRTGSIE